MHAGDGTNSDPVQSILVCFMCKHRNPIQNALKLLKGITSVTQWITFLTLNDVTGLVFRLRVYKHSRAHSKAVFCTRFVIACKHAH